MVSATDADSPRPRKAPRIAPAILTNSASISPTLGGAVLLADQIHPVALSRSPVLQGLGNTSGCAPLPSAISPEAFQLWQTACRFDISPSMEELVKILKVADLLADSKCHAWIVKLGRVTAFTDWSKSGDSAKNDDLLASLLTLPPHLLHAVLAHCCHLRNLEQLLRTFPPSLYSALLASAASAANGCLSIDIPHGQGTCVSSVFTALATAHPPPPGLQNLEIADVLPSKAACALLARALAEHRSLTSLQMARLNTPGARTLAAALRPAALPNLATLDIAAWPNADACAALAQCLGALPAISKLTVRLHGSAAAHAAPRLASFAGTAACQAVLPSLSDLTVYEVHYGDDIDRHANASTVALLLPMLQAPALTCMHAVTASASLSHAALLAAITPFQRLRHATLHVTSSISWTAADRTEGADATHCDAFEALEKLTVGGEGRAETLYLAAAAAKRASRSLTTLEVQAYRSFQAGPSPRRTAPEVVARAAGEMWRQVGRCTRLRHLDVDFLCWTGVGDAARVRGHSHAMADALAHLSMLTYLNLEAGNTEMTARGGCKLHGEVLAGALVKLTALQELHVLKDAKRDSAALELRQPEAMLAACAKLPLRQLTLGAQGPTLAHVAEVLPQLQHLTVLRMLEESYDAEGQDSLEELEARYSSINFWLHEPGEESEEEEEQEEE